MLVLSRKQSQSIVIGDQVEITVLRMKGNTVRLGIRAPHDVKVLRGELAPFGVEFELETDPESESVVDNSQLKMTVAQAS